MFTYIISGWWHKQILMFLQRHTTFVIYEREWEKLNRKIKLWTLISAFITTSSQPILFRTLVIFFSFHTFLSRKVKDISHYVCVLFLRYSSLWNDAKSVCMCVDGVWMISLPLVWQLYVKIVVNIITIMSCW